MTPIGTDAIVNQLDLAAAESKHDPLYKKRMEVAAESLDFLDWGLSRD